MEQEFWNFLTGSAVDSKELSLSEAENKIRQAVYEKLRPAPSPLDWKAPMQSSNEFYVSDVYVGYVIVCRGSAEFFKVPFTVTENGVVVGDQMVPVERGPWIEKGEPVPTGSPGQG